MGSERWYLPSDDPFRRQSNVGWEPYHFSATHHRFRWVNLANVGSYLVCAANNDSAHEAKTGSQRTTKALPEENSQLCGRVQELEDEDYPESIGHRRYLPLPCHSAVTQIFS